MAVLAKEKTAPSVSKQGTKGSKGKVEMLFLLPLSFFSSHFSGSDLSLLQAGPLPFWRETPSGADQT